MGFGTLFIGYFFLINISYFGYTDVIGALVMTLGLYRLSSVNADFKHGMIASTVFSVFGFLELALAAVDMFIDLGLTESATPYIGAMRYALIFVLTLYILKGIKEVSLEVEAYELNSRVKRYIPFTAAFLIAFILEIPLVGDLLGGFAPYVYFAMLLFIVIFIALILSAIYKAYMQICMPEDAEPHDKKSKFGFLNKFYDSIEQNGKEYAEYKMRRTAEKNSKRKK